MTELEKAKAYDKAIKRADELLRVCSNGSIQRGLIEEFFPELAENKDESIRRYLLAHFSRIVLEKVF